MTPEKNVPELLHVPACICTSNEQVPRLPSWRAGWLNLQ